MVAIVLDGAAHQAALEVPALARGVVLDARLRVPLASAVVGTVRETPTWVFASRKASPMAEEILQQKADEILGGKKKKTNPGKGKGRRP